MRDQLLCPPPSNPRVPAVKMAPEKHPTSQQTKPFTPTMSTAFRATKNPLTPKLAGYTPTRTTRKTGSTEPVPQLGNGISRPPTSTPTSTVLSANVTPRSGLRLSRRDGNSSPAEISPAPQYALRPVINAVPQPESPLDQIPKRDSPAGSTPRPARAKSVVNETHMLTPTSRPDSSCGTSVASSMFFHADDTRSPPSRSDVDTRLQKPSATTTTFLYADGTTSDSCHREAPRLASSSDKPPRIPLLRQPDAIVAPRSKQPYASATLPRDSQIPRHDRTPASSHPSPTLGQDGRRDQHSPNQHDISLEGMRRPSHTKSSSMDASEYGKHPKHDLQKQDLPTNLSGAFPYLTSSEHQPGPNAPSRDPRTRVVSGCSSSSLDNTPVSVTGRHSPVKDDTPRNSEIDKMNELASNARRERKVLDLEISNSSLLAINRTLEREMRKQSAELRRYRRLTRSGRLSMTDSVVSMSGRRTLSIVGETGDEPSDMSLMENSEDDFSDSSDDESTPSHDGTPNPNDTTEHDAKHRTKDEKRFILDLTKHQQLLIDSQKLNQSIKRCLGWTDSLIEEAKKALDYHVRVSDIDIGGRVLAPDEIEGDAQGGRGLLSPTSEIDELYSPPRTRHLSPSDISLPDSD
ncbi:hypothetical protein AJ78_05549 [Emergomyces pasteurianus Ep9510]|uniref:Uncharacterized protein n=1 Tax=Emergomyces pasteurianus Ep9510 TaxID=1447872 RepID=A0A1J9PC22_9EURO|nr:hypothetical protein AJ78_05549 [Emergomyces pasteurianus Ep9510]